MNKMLGKSNQPPCGSKCCGTPSKVKAHIRTAKRRERQAWKKSTD